jgi:DNA polymerase III delta subunit
MNRTGAFRLLNGDQRGLPAVPILFLSGYYEFVGEWVLVWAARHFLGEVSDFNFRRFYQDSEDPTSWQEVLSEAGNATFFIQDRKVVVFTLRDKARIAPKAEEMAALEAYIGKANANTLLVIYVSLEFSPDDFKMFKKQKLDAWAAQLEAHPVTWVDLDRADTGEIETWIRRQAEQSGVKLGGTALNRMFELWADEPLRLLPHVPKVLASVLPGQEVAVEDVERLVTGMTTHSIWDLIDAVEKVDIQSYMSILKYLIISGVKPPVVVGTLVTHYNKVLMAKMLLKNRVASQEIGRILKQPSFILNRFLKMVSTISDAHLRKILQLLYQLDYESKQAGEASSRLLLETFILELKAINLSLAGARRKR